MKNTKFIVKTGSKYYPIYFGNNILNTTGNLIKKNLNGVKKICIICDKKLPKFIFKKLIKSLKKYDLKIFKLPANEKTKSIKVANKIIELLLKYNFNRADCVIAFGGGIIGLRSLDGGHIGGFLCGIISFVMFCCLSLWIRRAWTRKYIR